MGFISKIYHFHSIYTIYRTLKSYLVSKIFFNSYTIHLFFLHEIIFILI
jgi:hypothetical protein